MNLEMQIPWAGFSMLGTYIVSALDHIVQIHNLYKTKVHVQNKF